jgi:hypothetical protein
MNTDAYTDADTNVAEYEFRADVNRIQTRVGCFLNSKRVQAFLAPWGYFAREELGHSRCRCSYPNTIGRCCVFSLDLAQALRVVPWWFVV